MHPINRLFTLTSINVLLVTIERFSFTTHILLQPYSFLRLHEALQICTLILFTVVIPLYILKEVTHTWELLSHKYGMLLLLTFIIGIYFYATGNGIHELASFQFNHYCDVAHVSGDLCGGMFFNDYYSGNSLYFFGAILMNISLMCYEAMRPNTTFQKKDLPALWINSCMYALAIFAYAAFDRVLVGLSYAILMTMITLLFFSRKKYSVSSYPITYAFLIAYVMGTTASLIYRLI